MISKKFREEKSYVICGRFFLQAVECIGGPQRQGNLLEAQKGLGLEEG